MSIEIVRTTEDELWNYINVALTKLPICGEREDAVFAVMSLRPQMRNLRIGLEAQIKYCSNGTVHADAHIALRGE